MVDQQTARVACGGEDADLVSISDQEEMNFVTSISWVLSDLLPC